MMRGRRAPNRPEYDPSVADKINFWDLVYPEETETTLSALIQDLTPKAFDESENKRVIDGLELYIQKKSEICFLFLDRVPESIAPDYKSFVSAEMWL